MSEKPRTIVDKTLTGKWRVYHWALRPDADVHAEHDKMHWKFDSEHATEHAAEARAKELARKKAN